ncbi:hypothetical protein [Aliarcobacter butzleri]|uniref:hypothetical protein n=1 Tax=Aliarcobacter butzleri TaxID=28197 RepID=UPI0024DE976D|nr:hypothetical protein [Aliarcobacter butzleri]MDK2051705.1 hypothetical protein [Aliarcobacter butzleri]MDN5112627.1 hypothetical protein [Aliarcobacter butzleri]
MFCTNCNKNNMINAKFCNECGIPLGINNSINGNGNLNFGHNNNISANNISLNYQNINEPKAYIRRSKTIPIKIGSTQITSKMTIFLGTIGFIGSIASIWSTWLKELNLLHVFFLCLIPFAGLGILLIKKRFSRLLFSWNIESNKEDKLFLTKIDGSCPKCDGILKLKEVGENSMRRTIVQCNRNKKHYWEFDFTILDNIN